MLRVGAGAAVEIAEKADRWDVGAYPSPSAYGFVRFLAEGKAGELANARLLELGAGTGAVGIAAAALGAHVVLTDKKTLVAQVSANCSANHELITGAGGTARALELDWTCERSLEDVRAQAFDEIDLLIGSDLIYPATSAIYKRLLRVLTTFSARRVLFAYPYKRDRAPANFFELARAESIRTVELHRDLEHEIAICELFLPNSAC